MANTLSPRMHDVLARTRWDALTQYAQTTSTNDDALALVSQTGNVHLVVTAERQTAGRGRLGRRWVHTAADAEPLSLAVTATLPAPLNAPMVPLAVGLAVYDTLADQGVSPALKWPNDLLLAQKKTAGILVERVPVAAVDLIVIGVGFNLDWRGALRDQTQPWTSLAEETGADVDAETVLVSYLDALDGWLRALDTADGVQALLESYRARCVTLGQQVTVSLANGQTLHGVAEAITDSGELSLNHSGTLVTVTSGDVWHHL